MSVVARFAEGAGDAWYQLAALTFFVRIASVRSTVGSKDCGIFRSDPPDTLDCHTIASMKTRKPCLGTLCKWCLVHTLMSIAAVAATHRLVLTCLSFRDAAGRLCCMFAAGVKTSS